MIAYLEGVIKEIDNQLVIININGVGYGVSVINNSSFIVGATISLYIRLCWHQDEGPILYGFKSKDERVVFDLITSCSGVGPKIGLAALEVMSPDVFLQAIIEKDIKLLSTVSGIGAKKAESMILQLKDKVAKLIDEGFQIKEAAGLGAFKDLSGVLTSLGYSQKEISPAIDYAREQLPASSSFDECLRKALSYLSKK